MQHISSHQRSSAATETRRKSSVSTKLSGEILLGSSKAGICWDAARWPLRIEAVAMFEQLETYGKPMGNLFLLLQCAMCAMTRIRRTQPLFCLPGPYAEEDDGYGALPSFARNFEENRKILDWTLQYVKTCWMLELACLILVPTCTICTTSHCSELLKGSIVRFPCQILVCILSFYCWVAIRYPISNIQSLYLPSFKVPVSNPITFRWHSHTETDRRRLV